MMSNEGASDAIHQLKRTPSYDVFLSCRAEDCFGLPGHLYNALQKKSITTFMTEMELEMRDNFFDVIEQSWVSVVVLSEIYLYSAWCLDELVKILECRNKLNQIVYPIYYELHPSEVRHERGACRQAMAQYEMHGIDPEKLRKWRTAFAEITKLSGFVCGTQWNQYEVIQKIVELVYKTLPRYDVFISFRGQDTGYTFTGNLYNALRRKKIKTFFINDEQWKSGDRISSSFLKAIGESSIAIVVLSKSYAYSTWCLDELTNIIEGKKMKNQLVWPIFYKVDPSHVRKQENNFGDAMAVQESRFGKNCDDVLKWKSALFKVSNFTGVTLETGYEYKSIQRIVESAVQSLSSYDVFLSFSGDDTRYSFAGYLYNSLRLAGFKTFMEDEELENGDQISLTLTKVIQNTNHSIIIFSKNYGYYSWCLDELVKILKHSKMTNHLIWPVFYNVELLDVRYQRKSYGDAMIAHEMRFGKDSDKVKSWKSALFEVTHRGGYAKVPKSKVNYVKAEHESELIKHIVEHISFPDGGSWSAEDSQRIMSTGGFISG